MFRTGKPWGFPPSRGEEAAVGEDAVGPGPNADRSSQVGRGPGSRSAWMQP